MQVTENQDPFIEECRTPRVWFKPLANRDTGREIIHTELTYRQESQQASSPGIGMARAFHLFNRASEQSAMI